MKKSTKTVWYKRAQHTGTSSHFQSLANSALANLQSPFARLWAPFGDGGEKYSINGFRAYNGTLVGQFVCFQPGQMQPVIRIAGGADAFDIEAMSAGGSGKEFLEGICYFLIFQDHVMFLSSKALGTKEFERYLVWMLAEATTTIPTSAIIAIGDQPTSEVQRRVANKSLRGVTFGSPLKPVAVRESVHGKSVFTYEASGGMWDGLRQFLGGDIFDNVKMTQALADANVEVQVTIRVKGKTTVTDDAHRMLEAVAIAARHLDPDDIALEVQGVGTVKGEEFKIHKAVSVALVESGGLVDETDLWQKVFDWLRSLIDNKTIPA